MCQLWRLTELTLIRNLRFHSDCVNSSQRLLQIFRFKLLLSNDFLSCHGAPKRRETVAIGILRRSARENSPTLSIDQLAGVCIFTVSSVSLSQYNSIKVQIHALAQLLF
jgi:hypothetical protein